MRERIERCARTVCVYVYGSFAFLIMAAFNFNLLYAFEVYTRERIRCYFKIRKDKFMMRT